MEKDTQQWKVSIFTFSASPFSGICNLIWKWSFLYSGIQKQSFVRFAKQRGVQEVLIEKTTCYGYIIILRQSRVSANSCAGCVQKYPANGANGTIIHFYLSGQTLYPQAVTVKKRHLLLTCAKALKGQIQRHRSYLPHPQPYPQYFEHIRNSNLIIICGMKGEKGKKEFSM